MRYKRAALKDHLGKITGTSAGALAGGLGGYGLASMFSNNKSIRILAALAGAVGGGYGGYRLGNYMDALRAGLIGKNEDLTNKYNASQDELQVASQLRDLTKGKLDAAQYNNEELAFRTKALEDLNKGLNKQLDIGAQQYAKVVAGNARAKALIDKQIKLILQLKAQQQLPLVVALKKKLLLQVAKLTKDIEILRKLRLSALNLALTARVDRMTLADKYEKAKNALWLLALTNKLYDTWQKQQNLKYLKLLNLLYKYAPLAASQYK